MAGWGAGATGGAAHPSSTCSGLRRDEGELQETITEYQEVRDTVIQLTDLMSGDLALVPEVELRALVRGSFNWSRFEPRISTYQDLVSSGNLRLIDDDSLRTAIPTDGPIQ